MELLCFLTHFFFHQDKFFSKKFQVWSTIIVLKWTSYDNLKIVTKFLWSTIIVLKWTSYDNLKIVTKFLIIMYFVGHVTSSHWLEVYLSLLWSHHGCISSQHHITHILNLKTHGQSHPMICMLISGPRWPMDQKLLFLDDRRMF